MYKFILISFFLSTTSGLTYNLINNLVPLSGDFLDFGAEFEKAREYLKKHNIEGTDISIYRELTGGIYFGEPRGIKPIDNGERKGINTHTYTTSEIIRVAKVAFDVGSHSS